jgi:hypothetical protein
MNLLIQFLLRLSFGLAAGMAITPSTRVTSGYFRNNLYVMLGLTTLAALVSYYVAPQVLWYAVAAAAASYVGSVCWLYEKATAGKVMLVALAMVSWIGLTRHASNLENAVGQEVRYLQSLDESGQAPIPDQLNQNSASLAGLLQLTSAFSSGLLLGMTMAAMLLGHWYLNSPTMELVPLRRLIIAMGASVALQAVVSALGLWGEFTYANSLSTQWMLFVLLRWLFGIVGVGVLAWMAWQTLNIPNTQSATGILYVAVIGTFVGETMALLLSAESLFSL